MSTISPLSKHFLICLCCLLAPAIEAQVVINEIHYEPEDKTAADEFIELHNASGAEIDLSGWYLSNGVFFTFPDGTLLPAGGYLVVAEDPETLAGNLAFEGALGPWEGRLDNGGKLTAAAKHFERAIQLQPELFDAHYGLAACMQLTGRAREALQIVDDYAARHGENGQLRTARKILQRALDEEDPP